MRGVHLGLDHNLDGVLDTIFGIADCGRKVVEWKCVGVNLGGVEALLFHEGLCPMRSALALTTNAVDIDVVADNVCDIDRHFLVRKSGENPPFPLRTLTDAAWEPLITSVPFLILAAGLCWSLFARSNRSKPGNQEVSS